jgi:hypothetical protein
VVLAKDVENIKLS